MRHFVHLIAWSFLLSSISLAQSPVWKVTKDGQSLYLGGTCHLLRASDLPLPAEFDHAYERADSLVFEIDPSEMEKPGVAMQLVSSSRYSDGSTLKDVLSRKAYNALMQQAEESGLPATMLNGFKPGMAVMMVTLQELSKAGVTEEGVDIIYSKRAAKDGKPIQSLETIAFQIEMIAGLGEGVESDFVLYSLRDLEQVETYFDELVRAWRKGDNDELSRLFVEDMREFPDVYHKLLVERNQDWIRQIKPMLQSPETELVLVGAGHLVGPDGLLKQLSDAGCQIENLDL